MKYQLCAVTTQGTHIPFVMLFLTYSQILYFIR